MSSPALAAVVAPVVTSDLVLAALRAVQDPEIPIDVVELGLIYDVRIDATATADTVGCHVEVDMTLTSMGCPCHDLIVDDVRAAVAALDGVAEVDVQVVWDPPWDRSRLGDAGVRYLPIIGIGV